VIQGGKVGGEEEKRRRGGERVRERKAVFLFFSLNVV